MFARCLTCGYQYYPPSHRFGGKAANTCLPCHRIALLERFNAIADDARLTWNATVGTPLYRAAMNRIYCRRRRIVMMLNRAFYGRTSPRRV